MGLFDVDLFDDFKRMNKRQVYYQVLTIAMVVASAVMIWKLFIIISHSESPLVVVLSGSMEPAFHRGDVLYLTNYPDEPIRVGDIVVFKIEGREIPIVHRVLKLHESLSYPNPHSNSSNSWEQNRRVFASWSPVCCSSRSPVPLGWDLDR
ncbi:Signal peptidase complex catalytic subunit SEC11C isoform 1 [Schistosoma japonicum]|uniref:Signal peptidase complex catalytic subunit SEC11 n=1 Tax=Schistosoma japonicum TaxID=6182 RepID=A0A4Z2CXH2_SCHJA|nr:Signal peptidase complex catalytic subunit SEC11C [Schistosoma japonicum]TNN08956.1 Signal peptidase complex catalytic subunit SEC11C isoform 1 [Schistosoma japonicum]